MTKVCMICIYDNMNETYMHIVDSRKIANELNKFSSFCFLDQPLLQMKLALLSSELPMHQMLTLCEIQ